MVLSAVASSGCGYALAGRGSFLPAYIRTVGIPPIQNATTFFRADQVLTEKIRTEFIDRGKYNIISTPTGAQAVLTGAITAITVQPIGFTDTQLASRYSVTVTMRVEFTDQTTNQVLWQNAGLSFSSEYDLQTRSNTALEGAGFLEQEGPAFDRISSDVARAVVTAILEAF